jgi:hypothetical protein
MASTQVSPSVPSTGGTSTSAEYMLGAFGDGSDGTYVYIPATYTINREWNYQDLTIQAGAIIKPAGFRMFMRGTLTNAGSFNDDGLPATGATNGLALAARQFLGAQSGAGGAGRSTTGVGTAGQAITSSSYQSTGVLPTGGAGGQGDGGNLGGAAGAVTAGSARWASLLGYGRGATAVNGGSGGGAGGCQVGTGTATSGGGGSGGGDVYIAARFISNTGTISALGGAGGNAVSTGDGKAGGGGGGGGGHVGIITQTPSASIGGTVSAAGGAGGAAAGTGSVGVSGTAGSVSYLILA